MVKRDMTRPNWARTAARLRKMAAELRAHDFQVIEPPNFDKPPAERYAQGGVITGVAVVFGDYENGPEMLIRRSGDHGLS
jgi:hypothetical protein